MAKRQNSDRRGSRPDRDTEREPGGGVPPDDDPGERVRERLARVTVPPELDSPENRKRWKLEEAKHQRGPYLIELNVQHISGLHGAIQAFKVLFARVGEEMSAQDGIEPPGEPVRVGKSYYRCDLRVKEWRRLVAEDERQAAKHGVDPDEQARYRCIYRLWPDFPVSGQISRSIATIKADAAMRSFEATGEQITWAVIDSGVLASHPHFGVEPEHALLHPSVRDLHRCYAPVPVDIGGGLEVPQRLPDPDLEDVTDRDARIVKHRDWALRDDLGHGSHVAGIICGRAPSADVPVVVLQRESRINDTNPDDDENARTIVTRARPVSTKERQRFHGVAPECRIVSIRVLDAKGEGRSSDVIRALEYVRETINDNPKVLRVHGVNLSVGYEFDAEMFACGQSPVCTEVNRLVQAGVVVVTAAGNTGYGSVNAATRAAKVGLSNTINDPGNAEMAITVGATHRESPHTYGVSYFSSKGPTGDGRLKPDLVAPGERIISCAAGGKLDKARHELPAAPTAAEGVAASVGAAAAASPTSPAAREPAFYVEDTGTSMAAPHVSGAIAAFLSIRREFIGRPLDVKRIFLQTAIPLGRERYFEGHGLLDLIKAIQSV